MNALRELLAEFTIDPTKAQAGLQTLDAGINRVGGALGSLVEAFVGSAMVAGVKSFIEGQIEAAKEARITAEKLGTSVEELEEFQFAAKRSGVEAEAAATGLKFLNKNVGLALTGNEEAAKTFGKLGIKIKGADGNVRELGDLLPDIADAFAGMNSQQERTAVAMQIFGRQGADLIPLLQQGSDGLNEMRLAFHELGGGISDEFIQRAKAAEIAFQNIHFGLAAIKRSIAFEALPYVVSFSDKLQKGTIRFLQFNKQTDFAKEAMGLFGLASATASAKAAVGFAKFLGIIPKDASFWKAALGLGEFAFIIAAIALVALAFEDLFGFLTGKESVIGEIIDDLFGIGASTEVINEVHDAFKEFYEEFEAFQPLAEEFGAIFKDIWIAALPYIKTLAKDYLIGIATQLKAVLELTRWISKEVGAGLEALGNFQQTAGGFLKKLGIDGADKLVSFGAAVSKTGAGIHSAATASIPKGQGATVNNEINQTNKVEVTVQGGNNPRETGAAVADGVKDGLSDLDDPLAATQWGDQ